MSINFNTLPTEKPSQNALIPTGQYKAIVKKATMKQPKDTSKPEYLNLELGISDITSGTPMGTLWAILTESPQDLPRYQLSRFIKALKLPITGEFELKDLTKMTPNRTFLVDITIEETTDARNPQRSVVDVKSGQIFYPIETETETTPSDDELPFTPDDPSTPPISSSY